jgi:hypothetical protein
MNKQEQIEQRLAKPVEIGDDIVITIKYPTVGELAIPPIPSGHHRTGVITA